MAPTRRRGRHRRVRRHLRRDDPGHRRRRGRRRLPGRSRARPRAGARRPAPSRHSPARPPRSGWWVSARVVRATGAPPGPPPCARCGTLRARPWAPVTAPARPTLAPARPEDLPGTADDWASLALGVVLGSHRFSVKLRGPSARVTVHLDVARRAPRDRRAGRRARHGATARARDLADTPSGTKSPDWFATHRDRPRRRRPGPRGDGPRRGLARRARVRRRPRRRRWLVAPAALPRAALVTGRRRAGRRPRRPRRQGHHVRHRRHLDQAERRHGGHAHRLLRRRRRGRRDAGGGAPGRPGPGHRPRAAGREPRVRLGLPARRRRAAPRGHHLGGHQHRRRGPHGARRRDRVRARGARAATSSSTSPPSPGR